MALSGHSKALTGARQRQALSADGSIVMVGGLDDNGGIGAAWAFTRTSDYREPLTPSQPPPNSPPLTASTPPLPPPNFEE